MILVGVRSLARKAAQTGRLLENDVDITVHLG